MIKDISSEIREIWKNRFRIWTLAKNDLKLEFGQSKLGLFWSLLEPAGIIMVYATIFPIILGANFYSWVLFFVAGFIPHRYLQEGVMNITGSLVDNKNILNQIDIKEEVIPISGALSSSIKFALECIVFFSIIFLSGVLPGFLVLIFPLIALIEFFIILGFGMHLSVSYIEFRDLDHILKIFFQALFFLVPIVYRLSKIPSAFRGFYLLNPISRLILLYQSSLLSTLGSFQGTLPVLQNLGLLLLFSVVVLVLGYTSFKRRKTKYVGEI